MKIGIDISPIQGPHRMRGVGSVVINFINNIPTTHKQKHQFIFYMEPNEVTRLAAIELLNLSDLQYEVRDKPLIAADDLLTLPGRLRIVSRLTGKLFAFYRFRQGLKGYDASGLDVYIHTDQMQTMPLMPGVRQIMIAYDIIPYVLEWDYLWTYQTARKNGLSCKAAIATHLHRRTYIAKLRVNAKKSHRILAISKQTKADFINLAKAPASKVVVTYLGVTPTDEALPKREPKTKFAETSWGYQPRSFQFDTQVPFLFYVGGTDPRRKLDDLVTAFNHLRARGHNLKLVLSGDILQGPKNLPVKTTREALLNSSYANDIIYLGFVSDEVRDWLYERALAFVYPSMYEGFGLPILEAMQHGSPVITYSNSSIIEVAGEAALYAHDSVTLVSVLEQLLQDPSLRKKHIKLGESQAERFTWAKTSAVIIDNCL